MFRCRLVSGRPGFAFSGFGYAEMEIPVPRHPEVLGVRASPLQVIRPEGAWDELGVLDRSTDRPTDGAEAA